MSFSNIISKYSKDSSNKIAYFTEFKSPVGTVASVSDNNFLYMVAFRDTKNFEKMLKTLADELSCKFVEKENEILQKFKSELDMYFEGKLKKFTVPVKTFGSEFQKEVWQKLQELPYGSTLTYGDLAKAMGRAPTYSRAIGAACGANAHLLVIPCHRLVASGSKGGFSCGIHRKEWLINHEKKHAQV